jgi:hypothetical protein
MLDVGCSRRRERAIALVITLIMLSVTLIMAVAFIAVSRRERNAVSTGTDATTARLAADSALAAAQAQIVANIFSSSNATAYDFHLLVSTNYINSFGFNPSAGGNPTNVNYDYTTDGSVYNAADFQQNIANLFFLPRAPVFVASGGSNDFRFYLDLNRNGRFEDSGTVISVDNFGNVLNSAFSEIGDPQWVGILERPDAPHSAENHFIARYAFLAQPIGNSLDVNGLHNETLNTSLGNSDGFFRNQGVGGWEMNLAAFLADLNTNVWFTNQTANVSEYAYNAYTFSAPGWPNVGNAFVDARALLAYRYSYLYNNLASANQALANPPANTILRVDNIDLYSDGPLQATTTNIDESIPANQDNPVTSWAGADSPTNFFALPSELFDANKVSANFVTRLQSAGTSWFGGTTNATYDRSTFYRMLDQLGTDSTVDDARMNLNFDNLTPLNGVASATNLMNWSALTFFTSAADRLLKFHTARWYAENPGSFITNFSTNVFGSVTFGNSTTNAFGVSAIPVYVNGQFVYTPAVNRLLQLAANLYDATTNDVFPSVFRPIFSRYGTNVYITGYTNIVTVSGPSDVVFSTPFDLHTFSQVGGVNVQVNIHGVPWILGAKKNMPAFNKFYSFNVAQFTRKIEIRRDAVVKYQGADESLFHTNIANIMSVTNHFGYSFWNPYNTDYPHGPVNVTLRSTTLTVLAKDYMTNCDPVAIIWPASTNFSTNFTVTQWPGAAWTNSSSDWSASHARPESFYSGTWQSAFLPESIYVGRIHDFVSIYNTNNAYYYPWDGLLQTSASNSFSINMTNYLQAFLIDQNSGRVLDYVSYDGPNYSTNLTKLVADPPILGGNQPNYVWSFNTPANTDPCYLNWGIVNQIKVSRLGPSSAWHSNPWNWNSIPGLPAGLKGGIPGNPESVFFADFYIHAIPGFRYPPGSSSGPYYQNLNTNQQAAYTPSRYVYNLTLLQANDPLVHYHYSDMVDSLASTNNHVDNPNLLFEKLPKLDEAGERYQPWGRQQTPPNNSYDPNAYNLLDRDPLVWSADFWDFPTNKLPSVGWIGRVHRGTPWQSVYLKSGNVLLETNTFGNTGMNIGTNTWSFWLGRNPSFYELGHVAPVEDGLLFDLFTATPNNNAQRGTLPVNQEHLAAWSALFSGLVVLTNTADSWDPALNTLTGPTAAATPILTNMIINPAGVDAPNSALKLIQNSILATRANTNLFPLGVFTHVGDILRAPALTEQSPFINFNGGDLNYSQYDISDALYEWLPQQIMGLVRLGTPRYVVYCYGQSLKPAKDGTVLSGGTFSQLVTNYQVTAERAVRVVLRVENPLGTNGVPPRVVIESVSPLEPQ